MEDFITIQSFMRTELNLSGNELLIYALIYGFSKDGESKFYGSRQYIADWCGISTRQVQTILNSLVERNIITKYEDIRNGVKNCQYAANFTPSEIISHPSEKTSLNNIINNISTKVDINNNNTKVLLSDVTKKKKSLYDKCLDEIYEYTKDIRLQTTLIRYLQLRLSMKDKPLYGVNQWKGLLKKLDSLAGDKCDIVEQSIERGWATFIQVIYNKSHSNVGELDIDRHTEREELYNGDESF